MSHVSFPATAPGDFVAPQGKGGFPLARAGLALLLVTLRVAAADPVAGPGTPGELPPEILVTNWPLDAQAFRGAAFQHDQRTIAPRTGEPPASAAAGVKFGPEVDSWRVGMGGLEVRIGGLDMMPRLKVVEGLQNLASIERFFVDDLESNPLDAIVIGGSRAFVLGFSYRERLAGGAPGKAPSPIGIHARHEILYERAFALPAELAKEGEFAVYAVGQFLKDGNSGAVRPRSPAITFRITAEQAEQMRAFFERHPPPSVATTARTPTNATGTNPFSNLKFVVVDAAGSKPPAPPTVPALSTPASTKDADVSAASPPGPVSLLLWVKLALFGAIVAGALWWWRRRKS